MLRVSAAGCDDLAFELKESGVSVQAETVEDYLVTQNLCEN